MRHILIMVLSCCLLGVAQAQHTQTPKGAWQDVPFLVLPRRSAESMAMPDKFRLLRLDFALANNKLPLGTADHAARKVTLDLPLPDGSYQTFQLQYDPVMHPDLAARYPQIRSYSGVSTTDPRVKTYLSISPVGLHATILNGGVQEQTFIEPVQQGDAEHYLCYRQSDSGQHEPQITCGIVDEAKQQALNAPLTADFAGDCQLRTYRLAIASTAEFTAASISPTDATGVTTTLANIAAMVTAINAIFINEFAIRLQLVADNDDIIFTDAATDGYTNGNQNTMATDGENQARVDAVIGAANYDIAHAFGTNAGSGGSGVSQHIGNVCVNGNKANAATIMATPNPVGFRFLIMHEFGHQFGADHTFNESTQPICSNAGQLNTSTAYEPGSGSTIMSYGGTCGSSNVIGNRDPYFHTISLQQVGAYTTVGSGSACPTTVALANSAPSVNSGGAGFVIPANTPFRLTATATDPNPNALTYCWEQFDNQIITHPPATTATEGPVFRSQLPSTSPTRYFPALQAILDGTNPVWEVLPSVSRTLNFTVTVRDNAAGGGCTDEASTVITVEGGAGPFRVSGIGADDDCLYADANTTITWDVANTTAPPVNCPTVDIWLSLDGGGAFSILLANNTPNDGSQSVYIPSNAITKQGRIMVSAADNVFLAINGKDIRIDCPGTRIVTDNPAIGVYKGRDALETSGTVVVPSGETTRFFAGQRVTMRPGFWAMSGSNFQARIKPCDACVEGKPAEKLAWQNPEVTYFDEEVQLRNNLGDAMLPGVFAFPNPFGQGLTLGFDLPEQAAVRADLFDLSGRLVRTLYQNDLMEQGKHQVQVDGSGLPGGIYDCRIVSGALRAQVKLVKIEER
jgi:hypothetical protein